MITDLLTRMGNFKTLLSSLSDGAKSFAGAIVPSTNDYAQEEPSLWDRFVDAIDKLIKPLLVMLVVGMFYWAAINPIGFILFAEALAKLPEMAWYIIFVILTTWFGAKGISEIRRITSPTSDTDKPAVDDKPADPAAVGRFANLDHDGADVHDLPHGNSALDAWRANATSGNPS